MRPFRFPLYLPPLEVRDSSYNSGLVSSGHWHLNALEGPPALHIACTVRLSSLRLLVDVRRQSADVSPLPLQQILTDADALISDLEAVLLELNTASPDEEGSNSAKKEEGQMVALYGLGASPVGSTMIPQVARVFLETLFKV